MLQKLPFIHPLLFAIYPILFFYSKNAWLFSKFELISVILGALLLIFLVHLTLAATILRNSFKVGIILSSFLIIFFLATPIAGEAKLFFSDIRVREVWIVFGILFLFFAGFIYRAKSKFYGTTKFMVAVSLFLTLFVTVDLIRIGFQKEATLMNLASAPLEKDFLVGGKLPDIYYIVLDGYANHRTLAESFDFNNDLFYDFLRNKGFYIASESFSNYSKTILSLASSLNMKYINYLSESQGIDSRDTFPLEALIQKNQVQKYLDKLGYVSINIESGFSPATITNTHPENSEIQAINPTLTGRDFLIAMFSYFNPFLGDLYSRHMEIERVRGRRVLRAFEKLSEVPGKYDEPVFVFAHILAPHEPFVLDRNCEIAESLSGYPAALRDNYIRKLECVNSATKNAIEKILSDSQSPPIIILQSDHGFASAGEYPNPEFIKARMRNFSAFYLPDGESLYKGISPVNIFRSIFRLYFGMKYELLPDRSYFTEDSKFYDFKDVTEIVL